jgi:hypothetical protein
MPSPHRLFPPIDPRSGRRPASKGVESRSSLTANGRIALRRRRFADGQTPMDQFLDQAQATLSLGVRQFCCLLNADSPSFARAANNLCRTTGVRCSAEFLRQVVEREGTQVLACSAKAGQLPCPFNAAADCTVNGVSRMYLGCDGFLTSMITDAEKKLRRAGARARRRHLQHKPRPLPLRKTGSDQRYKEFKLVTFYDESHEHRLVSVTRHNHCAAGRLMRRDGARAGFFDAQERLGVIDGGPWIINQIKTQSLPMTAVSLDFYHLAENVHKAKRSCFGGADNDDDDDDDTVAPNTTADAWAARTLHLAKHQGYDPLRDHLLQWRTSLKGQRHSRRRAADLLINYVTDRRELIDYPRFLKEQWQIGSGPTESQCNQVPRRVKGRGKRWDPDNAEAVMAIETLEQSNLTAVYWQTQANLANVTN